jgi:hypothetical protein
VVDAEPGASLANTAVLFGGRLTQSGWQVSRCALARASMYLSVHSGHAMLAVQHAGGVQQM